MIKIFKMVLLAAATALMLAVSVGCTTISFISAYDEFVFVDPSDSSVKVTITRTSGNMHIFPPEPFPPSSIVVEGSENGEIVIGRLVGPIEDWSIARILEDGTRSPLTLHNVQIGNSVVAKPPVSAQEVTLNGEVVKVGMTYEELVDKLGIPGELTRAKDPNVGSAIVTYWHSDGKSYLFVFRPGISGKINDIITEGAFFSGD